MIKLNENRQSQILVYTISNAKILSLFYFPHLVWDKNTAKINRHVAFQTTKISSLRDFELSFYSIGMLYAGSLLANALSKSVPQKRSDLFQS